MGDVEKRIVIVGASAAGLRCACRLARIQPGWKITVVEAENVFSYGACGMPYVLSGDIEELAVLRRTAYGRVRDEDFFSGAKSVDVRSATRAVDVDVERRTLIVEGPDGREELDWDELVLATGASPRQLPKVEEHSRVRVFHSLDDVKPLKQGLMRGEIGEVAIVGAGLVGCELAEAFASLWGADVTLIEAGPTPLPDLLEPELGAAIQRHLEENDVRVLVNSKVEAIEADDYGVRISVTGEQVAADMVVVAIGVRPKVGLAKAAGIDLGTTGAIVVDETMATSKPHIWAAGDCVETPSAVTGNGVHLPLGSLANRQGRVLANVLAGRGDRFPAVTGAMAVKVFDWNVASVGCSAWAAREAGYDVKTAFVTGEDCAHYWPEAKLILLAMVYDPSTRKVLGVQGAGEGEVAKRIDAASLLIGAQARLDAFTRVENAYAPPYAPAVDSLMVLACAAENQEDGVIGIGPMADLDDAVVLDVRIDEEREERPIAALQVVEIEFEEVSVRIDELPEQPITVVCAHGTRSAEIVRRLCAAGREARYLAGGMSWRVRALPKNE
ncbi:MAG: FAD-dependent oxidoreductase [bacterium]|nr:FAD-dependent oxidoreductase [bacterium]